MNVKSMMVKGLSEVSGQCSEMWQVLGRVLLPV